MASSLQNYVLVLLLIAIIQFKTSSTSSHHHHHHLKSLHFSLYQHETINKTGYIIVNGIPQSAGVTETTTPFGTLFVFQDPLTLTSKRSSKLVGIAEGTSITSSFDGLRSISIAKLTVRWKGYRGSVSIVGGTNNVKASDHPIVGGTEDFMFVQGYVTSSPVDLTGITVVYKIEFHIYWPPYATQSS
ncbi:hypothetical protein RYX36_025325 [Vicia faba]